jgi:hypothetical protein
MKYTLLIFFSLFLFSCSDSTDSCYCDEEDDSYESDDNSYDDDAYSFLDEDDDPDSGTYFFNDDEDVDCDFVTCQELPEHGSIDLDLSPASGEQVLIQVYEGNWENGVKIDSFFTSQEDYDLSVPLGEYAVTARYIRGTDTILAVDGVDLYIISTGTDDCDCPSYWDFASESVDLEI